MSGDNLPGIPIFAGRNSRPLTSDKSSPVMQNMSIIDQSLKPTKLPSKVFTA